MKFRKRFVIGINQQGFLLRNNKVERALAPGIYDFWDFRNRLDVIRLSMLERQVVIPNQEVLSKDNIALRISLLIHHRISDAELFIRSFETTSIYATLQSSADQLVANLLQIEARRVVSGIDSQSIITNRDSLDDLTTDAVTSELAKYGIVLTKATIRDITFPKPIQDLFARRLEARIRAEADLENARTAVASARALKNAAELMRGDEGIRFIQYLETITKIAAKGRHTFHIGEPPRPHAE